MSFKIIFEQVKNNSFVFVSAVLHGVIEVGDVDW